VEAVLDLSSSHVPHVPWFFLILHHYLCHSPKFNLILITINTIDNGNAHVNLIFHIHVDE